MYYSNKSHWKKRRPFFFLFIIAAIAGLGAVIMYLWNALLPGLLHVPQIGYWQALGLFVLCRLLFGGFRPGGGYRRHGGNPWREKFMNLSEEEKAALKTRWQQRCGNWREKEKPEQ
jgi:hypothetical protein